MSVRDDVLKKAGVFSLAWCTGGCSVLGTAPTKPQGLEEQDARGPVQSAPRCEAGLERWYRGSLMSCQRAWFTWQTTGHLGMTGGRQRFN